MPKYAQSSDTETRATDTFPISGRRVYFRTLGTRSCFFPLLSPESGESFRFEIQETNFIKTQHSIFQVLSRTFRWILSVYRFRNSSHKAKTCFFLTLFMKYTVHYIRQVPSRSIHEYVYYMLHDVAVQAKKNSERSASVVYA